MQTPTPMAPIERIATIGNTLLMKAGEHYVVTPPPTPDGYAAPPYVWRLKNMGPADVWVRWDGGDADVDDASSVVLDAGEIIPDFTSARLSMVCSEQPGGGARVSFMIL